MDQTIRDGMVVSLAYRLSVDGELAEAADPETPMYYLHGNENIVPGLEAALEGKRPGDSLSVTLTPDQAYGDYDEAYVQEVPSADFDLPTDLEVGMVVEIEDESGEVEEAVVREVRADVVVLDFNSPFAGKTVTFDVEVLSLRPATEDEIDNGWPDEVYMGFGDELDDLDDDEDDED